MKQVEATLAFEGVIIKGQEQFVPAENGIYAAYECMRVVNNGNLSWHPKRTLYVGKAEGTDTIRKRISDHANDANDRYEADSSKQSF